MTATTLAHDTATANVLYLAFELGANDWKLATTIGLGQSPRVCSVRAGDLVGLLREIAKAKRRFGVAPEAPVRTCYEAGRDGFWLHRWLTARSIDNQVIDSASIEVDRRLRHAKTDRLDAVKLVERLVRHHLGETRGWRQVQPPTLEQEDVRHVHRELETMLRERRQLANRMSGLLATMGIRMKVTTKFLKQLPELKLTNDQPLPPGLLQRLRLEFERWQLVHRQSLALHRQMRQMLQQEAAASRALQCLLSLRGIGAKGAQIMLREGLVWRNFQNRRQVASMAGLTPSPYGSGTLRREQGISKAGNARVRTLLVELAWGWLHYQPQSKLAQWYHQRFGVGNGRSRKAGIVALARKLLIALWKCATEGEMPAGAAVVDWETKFGRKPRPAA